MLAYLTSVGQEPHGILPVAGMGVIIGGLALAMLLPIFKLSSHVG